MRSASFLLSLVPLLSHVCAAPAPDPIHRRFGLQRNQTDGGDLTRANSRPSNQSPPGIDLDQFDVDKLKPNLPAGLNGCDFYDGGCECVRRPDASLKHLCGYIDPDWHLPTKRSVDLTIRQAAPPFDPHPQVLTTKDPLRAALNLLLQPGISTTTSNIVLNRVSYPTRGQFQQGLKGTIKEAATVDGRAFAAGAIWIIRWDFSWYSPTGALPSTGILGPHVILLVQDAVGAGQARVHKAFYPQKDDPFVTAEHPGDLYFEKVLDPLRRIAGAASVMDSSMGDTQQAAKLAAEWGLNKPAVP